MTEGRILLSEVYNYVYWLKCNQLCSMNVVFVTVCLLVHVNILEALAITEIHGKCKF